MIPLADSLFDKYLDDKDPKGKKEAEKEIFWIRLCELKVDRPAGKWHYSLNSG
jgi:hypothetical protein